MQETTKMQSALEDAQECIEGHDEVSHPVTASYVICTVVPCNLNQIQSATL